MASIFSTQQISTQPRRPISASQPNTSIFAVDDPAGASRAMDRALSPSAPSVTAPGSAAPAPASIMGPESSNWAQGAHTYTPGALINQQARQAAPQMGAAQQLGANVQNQGAQVAGQQAGLANQYNQAGQRFGATSQSVGPGFTGAQHALNSAAISPGQLGAAPQAAGVGNVNPSSLGAISQVAGQLGGGYQVGNVGGIAGRLGAAPSVGNVGNIQMGAGPGAVMPQLGSMGAQNAAQGEMLSRLSGFLDSPEGPSVAEAQLRQAQANNMADLIGAARSGRGGAGAQAQALRGAMSEGSAIMSDTVGQLATLRAQEEDMRRNRQLSAIGLGGEMAQAQRAGDLSFRGQDLAALQGDQSTALGARGQDLQSAMANQSTQTALEQLRANVGLGARGQDLSALQGDQSTALGLEGLRAQTATANRGQDLAALTADQGASVAARGQNLSALQGNQATGAQMSLGQLQANLGARGQDLSLLQGNQNAALGLANVNLGLRGQDANVLMGDADRNLAAQRLGLDAGLGYGGLANQANQAGLNFLSQANQQGVMTQGMQNDILQSLLSNQTSLVNQERAAQAGIQQQGLANQAGPSFWEQMALNTVGGLAGGAGQALGAAALSDERAKTDITGLDAITEHLRGAPGYRYRYKPGLGEDPSVEHAGPMAQDLERGPFGRALVKQGPDGLKRVDTGRLSLVNHAALASMRSELDRLKAQLEA